jgi:hypothetical protein
VDHSAIQRCRLNIHRPVSPVPRADRSRLAAIRLAIDRAALSGLPNIEHILIDADGRQHVVLRSGARLRQLLLTGDNAVIAPVVLGVHLRHRSDVAVLAAELAALQALLSSRSGTARKPARWMPQTVRLRDALIVLDGHRAGATLREIAVVIYGRERIERDWPDRGLRLRVHRALARGEALCDGGYRELLRKGCSI